MKINWKKIIFPTALATIAILFCLFSTQPAQASSKVIRTFRVNPNCTEQDQNIFIGDTSSPIFRLTSCIYLTNNNTWIKAVVSWNNISCYDYDLYPDYSMGGGRLDNGLEFDVQNNGTTIHTNTFDTCGNSGHAYWVSKAINNHSYRTYALFQPVETNYDPEYADYSPSLTAKFGNNLPTPTPSSIKIHGIGNYR